MVLLSLVVIAAVIVSPFESLLKIFKLLRLFAFIRGLHLYHESVVGLYIYSISVLLFQPSFCSVAKSVVFSSFPHFLSAPK